MECSPYHVLLAIYGLRCLSLMPLLTERYFYRVQKTQKYNFLIWYPLTTPLRTTYLKFLFRILRVLIFFRLVLCRSSRCTTCRPMTSFWWLAMESTKPKFSPGRVSLSGSLQRWAPSKMSRSFVVFCWTSVCLGVCSNFETEVLQARWWINSFRKPR